MKIYALTEMTELPIKCNQCNKFVDKGVGYCNAKGCWTNYYQHERPNWCPLRTAEQIIRQQKQAKIYPQQI